MVDHGDAHVAQMLIQWSQLPLDLASWEYYDSLKQLFPVARAWGQAGFKEGGNVSNHGGPDSPSSKQAGPRRSTREREPNEFIIGPDCVRGIRRKG
jgi:hypothetical protein